MKAEDFQQRKVDVEGWQVNLTSYRIGAVFYCKADNVSPGAAIARAEGATREEAETKALATARERLARTRRHKV